MTDVTLPDPLTPADCDLRDFAFMPLDVSRLRRSKAWLLAKKRPELAFYMLNLWAASWHDLPAASLEDDDDVLADAAMCDPSKWDAIRAEVLRGWIKCRDGRLYHPVVAEKALEAWARKQAHRERGKRANSIRWGARKESMDDPSAVPKRSFSDPSAMEEGADSDPSAILQRSPDDRKGQGQGQGQEIPPPSPPPPDGGGGSEHIAMAEERTAHAKPQNWRGQWRGLRATGSNPRASAAVQRAQPPPEPDHPLWPKCRGIIDATEFRSWIGKCRSAGENEDGAVQLVAPSRLIRDRINAEYRLGLERAFGKRVVIEVELAQ